LIDGNADGAHAGAFGQLFLARADNLDGGQLGGRGFQAKIVAEAAAGRPHQPLLFVAQRRDQQPHRVAGRAASVSE
jgi:hypothetical protein